MNTAMIRLFEPDSLIAILGIASRLTHVHLEKSSNEES